jgi:hypothetical protein
VLVPVSAHGSAKDRNCALASTICLIGYARVSTAGQTLDSQIEQLRGAGCTRS